MIIYKIAFPIFSFRWTIHAWNKKLEIFQRSPRPPDSMMGKIVILPNNFFSHTTSLQEGGGGFFQFFHSKREEKIDNFLFFTFLFFVKKTFLEKKLSFFVIFLISIFRFFLGGEKCVIQKKGSLHS